MDKWIDALGGACLALLTVVVTLGIAFVVGVPPRALVVGSVVAGLAMFFFGGRRARLVVPTIVFAPLILVVRPYGIEGLITVGVLAGLLQILIGVHGVGRAFASAPAGLVRGLIVAAAGVVLFDLAALPTTKLEWLPRAERFLALDPVPIVLLALELALLSTLLARLDRGFDDRLEIGLGLTNTASALLCGVPHTPVRDGRARSFWFVVGHGATIALVATACVVDVPRLAMLVFVVAAAVVAVEPSRLARDVLRSRVDALSALVVVLATIALGFGRAIFVASVIALAAFARARGRLSIRVRQGSVTEAALGGELFFASRSELAALADLEPVPPCMVIDASGVTLIDVSGVHALAQVIDALRARGCAVTVRASPQLQSMLAAF